MEKAKSDAPLLLGERTLEEIEVDIALRPRDVGGNRWQFHLPTEDDDVQRLVKVESAKLFRRRLRKGPKVYVLVEYNPLLYGKSTNSDGSLPGAIRRYIDVFSPQNANKLPPNREGINLAIEL